MIKPLLRHTLIVAAVLAAVFFLGFMSHKPKTIVEVQEVQVTRIEYTAPMSRLDIAEHIAEYRQKGRLDAVAVFYNTYVKDMDLTYLILSAAYTYDIPENVLFSLIWAESNFNPGAVNGHGNKDGSNDKGLMQLNSRYFGKINRLDPRTNLQYGCKHLRARYEKYGTWDEAVMLYNGFSLKSAEHQAKVLAKERELDKAFSLEFGKVVPDE